MQAILPAWNLPHETRLPCRNGTIRTFESKETGEGQGNWPLNLRASAQKGVDFCGKESVTVVVPAEARWPCSRSYPACDAAIAGFGGDGGGAVATEKGS